MITTILWDVDGTLLDFRAAEANAMHALFDQFDLGTLTDEMLARYVAINTAYWKQLEKGEISRAELLTRRFIDFFREYNISEDQAESFNLAYQHALGDTIVYCDHSDEVIRSLKGKLKQYVVTNGSIIAQNKKLEKSGLGKMMDGIFISEEVGAEKPSMDYFEHVFRHIEEKDKKKILIVGDTLSSDMQGGMNAGIRTCWYNPQKLPVPRGYTLDHVIDCLDQIYALCGL